MVLKLMFFSPAISLLLIASSILISNKSKLLEHNAKTREKQLNGMKIRRRNNMKIKV